MASSRDRSRLELNVRLDPGRNQIAQPTVPGRKYSYFDLVPARSVVVFDFWSLLGPCPSPSECQSLMQPERPGNEVERATVAASPRARTKLQCGVRAGMRRVRGDATYPGRVLESGMPAITQTWRVRGTSPSIQLSAFTLSSTSKFQQKTWFRNEAVGIRFSSQLPRSASNNPGETMFN